MTMLISTWLSSQHCLLVLGQLARGVQQLEDWCVPCRSIRDLSISSIPTLPVCHMPLQYWLPEVLNYLLLSQSKFYDKKSFNKTKFFVLLSCWTMSPLKRDCVNSEIFWNNTLLFSIEYLIPVLSFPLDSAWERAWWSRGKVEEGLRSSQGWWSPRW